MSYSFTSVRNFFAGLCLLLIAPAVFADGCLLERVAEVAMPITKSGQVVVPVEINGKHVKMAIDTTSSITSIYSGAITALNLKPANTLRGGRVHVGATAVTQTVDIRPFTLANLRWKLVTALVYPLKKEFPPLLSEDDVVGSIGMEMIEGVDIELDFGASKMRLYSQKHCPGNVVYWSTNFDVLPLQKDSIGDTYIIMLANGKPVAASIATMTPLSIMEEDAAKKVLGLDRSSAGIEATGGGDGCTFCGSITLKAQGLEIDHARVRIVKTVSPTCHLSEANPMDTAAHYDCGGAFPLQLGMNVLSQLHLYFATRERNVYFTDANLKALGASTEPASLAPTEH